MVECAILIPTLRDSEISDGEPHGVAAWQWLEERILERFGGFTIAPGEYPGIWKSALTSSRVSDRSKKYYVAIAMTKVDELRAIVREACVVFQQQCLYLSVAGHVEFIEPKAKKRRGNLR